MLVTHSIQSGTLQCATYVNVQEIKWIYYRVLYERLYSKPPWYFIWIGVYDLSRYCIKHHTIASMKERKPFKTTWDENQKKALTSLFRNKWGGIIWLTKLFYQKNFDSWNSHPLNQIHKKFFTQMWQEFPRPLIWLHCGR